MDFVSDRHRTARNMRDRHHDVLLFGTDTERDYEEEDNMAFDNTYGTDIHGIAGDADSICPQYGTYALRPIHRSGQAEPARRIGTLRS